MQTPQVPGKEAPASLAPVKEPGRRFESPADEKLHSGKQCPRGRTLRGAIPEIEPWEPSQVEQRYGCSRVPRVSVPGERYYIVANKSH